MYFFCYISNVMIFKNYKTIYLQIFNKVKIIMEKFKHFNYYEIILFFCENDIVTIQITFLITYIYLMDIMTKNVRLSMLAMMERMNNNIIGSGIIFFSFVLLFLFVVIFVYIKNVNIDYKKFLQVKKIFKVCNTND